MFCNYTVVSTVNYLNLPIIHHKSDVMPIELRAFINFVVGWRLLPLSVQFHEILEL